MSMTSREQFKTPKKRKHTAFSQNGTGEQGEKLSNPKKPKLLPCGALKKPLGKAPVQLKQMSKTKGSKMFPVKSLLGGKHKSSAIKKSKLPKKGRRLMAKELADARKKKRKPHHTLQQELALLWEKMRQRNIIKNERSKLISESLRKMCGKMAEIASSHISSRVLQTCIKYCSQAEKEAVFEELHPHILNLSCNVYGVHLVKKMLDNASRKQLEVFMSSLRGHVASLLRHMVGSVVVEHSFKLGNASQRQRLLSELYSTELQLVNSVELANMGRLVDIISKLGLQRSSVLQHINSTIQPILEKGIVDHSIIHTILVEYLSIADKSSATDVIQQLSSPLLIRMIHTKDGSKLGILCIKHGGAKERKKIIKGIKDHIVKIALDPYGSLVLACILSVVDDTKLLTKIIIRELQRELKLLILDKNGRRPIMQLLHPQCLRYLTPADLAALSSSVPSLSSKDNGLENADLSTSKQDLSDSYDEISKDANVRDCDAGYENNLCLTEGGRKDPALRRYELLVDSGLAGSLLETCTDNANELLRSNFGREVIYEVATGGTNEILCKPLSEKLDNLHRSIASLGALPRSEESDEEHVFENFHSSRTIRKLILDCPPFASALWKTALEGRSEIWARGHSAKVVSAFLESPDPRTRDMAKTELHGLVESGVLKVTGGKNLGKDA